MSNTPKPVSVLDEILAWSKDCPAWQRDALRRIISSGELTKTDLAELEAMCRARGENAVPLDAAHLPAGPNAQDSVTLLSLGALKGVNRIPSSQTIAFGASPGLTVIYGDNGAGKSGYARVLKRACRARGAVPEIHPDAYAASGANVEPSAVIEFSAGGTKSAPFTWTPKASERKLGNVFVFDSHSAANYLTADGAASFTPHGLDVLPKLSRACDEIRGRIDGSINSLQNEISTAAATWNFGDTAAGRLIKGISDKTTAEEIDAAAAFSDIDAKRLADVSTLLKANPKQKARETRASAARLVTFSTKLKTSSDALGAATIAELRKRCEAAVTTAAAAKKFAEGAVVSTDLTHTGSALWAALWEAARKFSESEAYAGREFPVLDDAAVCVLCQQPVGPAKERLQRFHELAKNELQKAADLALLSAKEARDAFERVQSTAADFDSVGADLSIASPEQIEEIKAWVKACDDVIAATKECLKKGTWTPEIALPKFPGPTLTALVDALNARAKEEESAEDPTVRKALQAEQEELSAREWLSKNKVAVGDQTTRYKTLAALRLASDDTDTRKITAKNSKLTAAVVEGAFCGQFKAEADALGLKTIKVKLESLGGRKGETKFGLKFEGSSRLAVHQVASEGEQRCIALAAFLAELSQASHQSALVFDDPVCSLDHDHRWHIAARLAKEGLGRQVIVLTHDTVFLNDLIEEAEKAKVSVETRFLSWNGEEPGHVSVGLPWDHEKPSARLALLNNAATNLGKSWGPKPNDAQAAEMRFVYSRLRATLELIIERFVLGDVVFRYRSHVKSGNLNKLLGFTAAECGEYERLLKKCHEVTEAHAAASGKQAPLPTPAELLTDIAATEAVMKQTKARQ